MTNQQTRTLADYPVGSRWRSRFGAIWKIAGYDRGNLIAVDDHGTLFASPSEAATWTRLDEPAPDGLREAILREVAIERGHQIAKGWGTDHDDEHADGEIARQAAFVISPNGRSHWVKPGPRRANLIKGIALAVAEVERLDRAALAQPAPEPASDNRTAQQHFAEQIKAKMPAFDERRDRFAAAALTGILANSGLPPSTDAARYALMVADALIAAMEADRG